MKALSGRELEVVTLVARGKSTPEIGVALGISTWTAKRHLEKAMAKLGAENRTHAAAIVVKQGLVTEVYG